MITAWPCQIEAVFGSSKRGDHDRLSDVDYLIADDDVEVLARRKLWLLRSGFSVSDYPLKRLRRLFERRTLFAAHLKFESKVVFDVCGEFAALTHDLDPFRDYSQENDDAERLFAPLEVVPDSNLGAMWALDHLAVALRNYLIVHFAQQGQFIYGYDALLNAHCAAGSLSDQSAAVLRHIRVAKHCYRRRVPLPEAQVLARKAFKAANSALDFKMQYQFAATVPDAEIRCAFDSTDAYIELREIERELVAQPVMQLDKETAQIRRDVLRTIRDPHNYLWKAMYQPQVLEEALTRLRSCYIR